MRRQPVSIARNGDYYQLRYYDSAGRQVRRSIGKVSKAEAERQRITLAAEFQNSPGRADIGKAPRLSEWRETFLSQRENLREGTTALFEQTFDRLSVYFPNDPRLDKITRAGAAAFRTWLAKQKSARGKDSKLTLSETTVCRYIRDAKVIFRLAADQDLVPFNPFDRVKSTAPRVSKDWAQITRDQLDQLLGVLPDAGWRALVALCRLAGLRRGEALRLTWEDVDWTRRTLHVLPQANEQGDREETSKQRERWVPIEPRLMEVLRETQDLAPEDQAVVCGVNSRNLERAMVAYVARAKIGKYKKPFHTLRKNLENEWKRKLDKYTLAQVMGHSPEVADNNYLRPETEDMVKVTGPIQGQPTG